jgi:hypothetical protein
MGIPLPRLTASKNRKLAITVHREGGATREEQVALAKHMAHSVVTADKYYDKSDQREARHHCLDAVSLGSGMPMVTECLCHSASTNFDMA